MTKEELKKELSLLRQEFEHRQNVLYYNYATSNNTVEIGDIIRDHIGFGRVLKMKIYISSSTDEPSMTYYCTVLNKDGTERKVGEKTRWFYQINLKQIIKQE